VCGVVGIVRLLRPGWLRARAILGGKGRPGDAGSTDLFSPDLTRQTLQYKKKL